MALDDFQGVVDMESTSTAPFDSLPEGDESVGAELESIIKDAFDALSEDNSKSLYYEGEKVVVDRQELVDNVVLMCAMTVKKVNS